VRSPLSASGWGWGRGPVLLEACLNPAPDQLKRADSLLVSELSHPRQLWGRKTQRQQPLLQPTLQPLREPHPHRLELIENLKGAVGLPKRSFFLETLKIGNLLYRTEVGHPWASAWPSVHLLFLCHCRTRCFSLALISRAVITRTLPRPNVSDREPSSVPS